MRFDINDFIKRYKHESKQDRLASFVIDEVLYYRQTDEVIVKVHNAKVLPYDMYNDLKDYLRFLISHDVRMIVVADAEEVSVFEMTQYLRGYSMSHHSLFKSALPVIKDDTLTIFYEDKEGYDGDESHFDDLKLYLANIGYRKEVAFAYQEEKRTTEEVKVTISAEKKAPIPETTASEKVMPRRKERRYTLVRIDDLSEPVSDVEVQGEIFHIERITTKNNHLIATLYIKNQGNAVIAKAFEGNYFDKKTLEGLKTGSWVSVAGSYNYDKFLNDHLISAEKIASIEALYTLDDKESEKRVELHAHTNKSEMDGVAPAEELIKAAFDMGHKAIAITDHYVTQAFPVAQKAVKACLKKEPERDFKVLYGCELAMVDERLDIVYNSSDKDLADATYVVFDLETTGLSNKYDYIIEFGAVTMCRGDIKDARNFFIKPPVELSKFTTSLTNISSSDLANAKSFAECKDEILDYLKDKVLVAHNASFDVGFLNGELLRLGEAPLENTVIDTLDLARSLFPNRRHYRLGNIAKGYRVPYDENVAHRANYDANVLAQVFNLMLEEVKQKGVKTFAELADLQPEKAFAKKMAYHTTVLCKNKAGLKDLFKLVSIAHTDTLAILGGGQEVNAEPRIFRSKLNELRKDLLIGSACLNGEIFEIASTRSQKELEEAIDFYDYIEVQPLENYRLLYEARDVLTLDKLKSVLRNIIMTAKKAGKIVVATGDAHYVHPDEKELRDVYINALGVGGSHHPLFIFDKEKRARVTTPDQRLLNTADMLEAFAWLEDSELIKEIVITNTNKIADMCDFIEPIHSKLYTPVIEGSDEKLRSIVYERAHELYGENIDQIIADRLEKELNAIIGNGYGVIYYVSHLLVKKSNEDGYLVGSRGSVGSSLVATMAGITEVNPLAAHYICPKCHHLEWVNERSGYNLPDKTCPECGSIMRGEGQNIPFETFLGFDGDKVPDIDLNFSGEYQEKAHLFTREVFGEDHVFRAGTISTVAEKTAFGYVSGYCEEKGIADMSKAKRQRLASGCQGVKRTTGQHPGGIVVIPGDMEVYDFTPVQFPANEPSAIWRTTHFDFHEIHDNVLKFDILGHVDPTAMRLLESISGIDPKTIPMNDPEVISLFSSTRALNITYPDYNEVTGACGLPEFGTRFVRGILEMTKPQNFSDLVQISGLSHGTNVWNNNAKNYVEAGIALADVIGCRDDIMTTLISFGLSSKDSFDIMESVRKGKGLTPAQETAMNDCGVPEWYITSCKMISYLFPKSHAVAYVIMAVRIAWFKVYYPAHYYVSYLSLRCDSYDIEAMIQDIEKVKRHMAIIEEKMHAKESERKATKKEIDLYNTLEICYEMKARGYDICNIDINRSLASEFIIDPDDNHKIIPPFKVLDGLGEAVAESIVNAREEKAFISKEDLLRRTTISKTLLGKLEDLGILDGLDDYNQTALF